MADSVYLDIIKKLREYVAFQIELDIETLYPKEIKKPKRKRKYMYYKFGPPIE